MVLWTVSQSLHEQTYGARPVCTAHHLDGEMTAEFTESHPWPRRSVFAPCVQRCQVEDEGALEGGVTHTDFYRRCSFYAGVLCEGLGFEPLEASFFLFTQERNEGRERRHPLWSGSLLMLKADGNF